MNRTGNQRGVHRGFRPRGRFVGNYGFRGNARGTKRKFEDVQDISSYGDYQIPTRKHPNVDSRSWEHHRIPPLINDSLPFGVNNLRVEYNCNVPPPKLQNSVLLCENDLRPHTVTKSNERLSPRHHCDNNIVNEAYSPNHSEIPDCIRKFTANSRLQLIRSNINRNEPCNATFNKGRFGKSDSSNSDKNTSQRLRQVGDEMENLHHVSFNKITNTGCSNNSEPDNVNANINTGTRKRLAEGIQQVVVEDQLNQLKTLFRTPKTNINGNSELNRNRTERCHNNSSSSNSEDHYNSNVRSKFSINNRLKRFNNNLQSGEYIQNVNHKPYAKPSLQPSVKPSSLEDRLKNYKPIINTDSVIAPIQELTDLFEDETFATHSDFCEVEDMEWSPIDEEEVSTNLKNLRKENGVTITFKPQTQFQQVIANASQDLLDLNKNINKTIYVVVDTNIFISHLKLLRQLMQLKINGIVLPVIFVPWIVIQELDHLKDGKSGDLLKKQARSAVHFINDELQNKKNLLRGQSVNDAVKVNAPTATADDGVLHCAMQLIKNGNQAYLLTNDVNLRNKAIINGVVAYSHSNILHNLDPFSKNKPYAKSPINEKCDTDSRWKSPLSRLFSNIILEEMKEGYGSTWSKIMKSSPPWTLKECLELFEKYWVPVFGMSLTGRCRKTINEFLNLTKLSENNKDFKEKLVEHAFALCTFFKMGYPNYMDSINECVASIEKCINKGN